MSSININKFIDNSKLNKFHMTIFILFLSIISFDGFDMVIYGATMPTLMDFFNINSTEAGIVASYCLLGAAIGAFAFGLLADKIGRKKVIVATTLIFTLATFFTGMAKDITTFTLLRFLTGLGLGGVMPNVVALSTEFSPLKNRAMIIAIIFSGMQIGGILASVVTMIILPNYGWQAVYYVGIIRLLIIPFVLKYIPESTIHLFNIGRNEEVKNILKKLQPDFYFNEDVVFTIPEVRSKSKITDLFGEHRLMSTILIWIVYFMNMYMIFGLSTWLPTLMMLSGFAFGSGLLFLLTLNLGALVGSNIAGLLVDHLGYKKTLIALYLIAFCSIFLLSLSTSFIAGIVLVAFAGIGFYGGQNVAHAYVGLFYPPAMRSTAMGFAFGIGRFGAIFGPMIAGVLMTMKVSMFINFMVLALPGIIAAVAVFAIQDKYGFLQNSK